MVEAVEVLDHESGVGGCQRRVPAQVEGFAGEGRAAGHVVDGQRGGFALLGGPETQCLADVALVGAAEDVLAPAGGRHVGADPGADDLGVPFDGDVVVAPAARRRVVGHGKDRVRLVVAEQGRVLDLDGTVALRQQLRIDGLRRLVTDLAVLGAVVLPGAGVVVVGRDGLLLPAAEGLLGEVGRAHHDATLRVPSAVEEVQLGMRDLLAQHAERQSPFQQRFDDGLLGRGEVVDENLGAVHGRVLRGEHLLDAIDGRRGADDAFDLVEVEVDDEAVHGAQVNRVRQDPTGREPGEQLPGELLISDEAGLGDTQARAVRRVSGQAGQQLRARPTLGAERVQRAGRQRCCQPEGECSES